MLDQLHHLGDWLTGLPAGQWAPAVAAALLVLGLAAVTVRIWRGRSLNAKKVIGFGVVQAGVTFIVVTGVYEFFHGVLAMPVIEAAVLAVFIEAATWGAVGFIYAHGRSVDEGGKPATGFGEAGPFFWFSVAGGGALAVLGSASGAVAIGRIVIVCLGGYMWYLQLLQVTRRCGKRSRWRWTPKRLLLSVGAMEPADEDVTDEAREWQVRRLARAIRWRNSRWPWSYLGGRALVKRAETTTEDVLAEARRRWAAAHVLREHTRPGSPVMASVIEAVKAAQTASAGRAPSKPLENTHSGAAAGPAGLDIDKVAAAVLPLIEAKLPTPTPAPNGANHTGNGARTGVTVPATRAGAGTPTAAKPVTAETASFKVPSDPTQQAVWRAVWAEIKAHPGTDGEVANRDNVSLSRQVVNRIRRAGEQGLLDHPTHADTDTDTEPGTAQPPRLLEPVS
jgi:hypothetical protein